MFCVICKKYKYPIFLLCKNFYCGNHAKIHYSEQIVIIQKIYRGHKVRRILNNIYFKLPRDIQTHILSFNCGKAIESEKNNTIKILHIIKQATHKINDFHNLSNNKITLDELYEILEVLNKYKNYITSKWFNYYKYYFNNIYSILLLLCEVQDLPYTFAHLVSIINNDIYDSLDFINNLSNNDFKKRAKEIMHIITLFFVDRKPIKLTLLF
jgi:hypothetical protein